MECLADIMNLMICFIISLKNVNCVFSTSNYSEINKKIGIDDLLNNSIEVSNNVSFTLSNAYISI